MTRILLLYFLFFLEISVDAQRLGNDNPFINDPPKSKSIFAINSRIKLPLSDVILDSGNHYYELSLINYDIGQIDHKNLNVFINVIAKRIQSLRNEHTIKTIKVLGCADANRNYGIDASLLKICTECRSLIPDYKVFDMELAKLRACIVVSQTKSVLFNSNYFITLNFLTDYKDEEDNANTSGFYRKVVVKIEY